MTRLVVAAIFCGLLTAWVFSRTVNVQALRVTLRQIHAHFLEFRLFFDEPRLIWRAQKDSLRANLRLCGALLLPALILALPMTWVFMQLDVLYGAGPLRLGEPVVVTAQMATDLQRNDSESALRSPPGIAVETPPVRIVSERQIAWRIRPLRPASGGLHVTLRGVTLTKSMAATRRERPLLAFYRSRGIAPAGRQRLVARSAAS